MKEIEKKFLTVQNHALHTDYDTQTLYKYSIF